MVRLKVATKGLVNTGATLFQFQYGSIKSSKGANPFKHDSNISIPVWFD